MNFLSNFYRNSKIFVAGVGAIFAIVVIVVGVLATKGGLGVALIVGGATWLTSSGFILFDSIAVHSIIKKDVEKLKKGIAKFEKQNIKLQDNVDQLSKTKNEFIFENVKLAKSVTQSQDQIKTLSDLKVTYEDNIKKYQKSLENEKITVDKLKEQIVGLDKIKQVFYVENNKLKDLIESNQEHIEALEDAKKHYIAENEKLQALNIENEKNVKELQNQVLKLKTLYDNTKELLKKLAEAGDMFSEFGETMATSTDKLQDTTNDLGQTQDEYDATLAEMKNLLERLKDKKFEDLDENDDGIITEEEFKNAFGELDGDPPLNQYCL